MLMVYIKLYSIISHNILITNMTPSSFKQGKGVDDDRHVTAAEVKDDFTGRGWF